MTDGKICYLEIPAPDIDGSARFYERVFGWKSRARGDGHRAFDDTTGAVSGSWVLGRKPSSGPGVLTYVMVDSIDATVKKVLAAGGKAATPRTPLGNAGEAFATFLDPPGTCSGCIKNRSDEGAGLRVAASERHRRRVCHSRVRA